MSYEQGCMYCGKLLSVPDKPEYYDSYVVCHECCLIILDKGDSVRYHLNKPGKHSMSCYKIEGGDIK